VGSDDSQGSLPTLWDSAILSFRAKRDGREEMMEWKKQQNEVITTALVLYEQALSDLW